MEELANDPPCTSITPNELDFKVQSLISVINRAITFLIPKAKLSLKTVAEFNEKCKKNTYEGQKA